VVAISTTSSSASARASTGTILPDPAQLHLRQLRATDQGITALVSTTASAVPCPICRHLAARVHSRYTRSVADVPWHAVSFRLELHVRRFFCDRPDCPRRIFTERLPGVVAPYARRTQRLAAWVREVGFALGGKAGARLLSALGVLAGADTLLRAVRRAPLPAAPACSVVSVDDWCLRRGQTSGAILVDLERRRVVDLLPDREADTFAAWLQTQPQIRVISRDRGANFAEGATRGAPQAVQVADRFHILKNLVEALQHVLGREQAALRAAAQGVSGTPLLAPRGMTAPRARARAEAQARRQARYDAVHRLHAAGKAARQIIAELRIGPNTLRRSLRSPTCPERAVLPTRRSRLAPFEPYLRERWDGGEQSGQQLLREIRERGYAGSGSNLYSLLALWRVGPRHRGPYARQAVPAPAPPPPIPTAPRTVCWLLLREDGERSTLEQNYVAELLRSTPRLAQMTALVRTFFALLNERRAGDLEAWLQQATASGIAELAAFAEGVRRDLAAVQAAMTLPWSQGQTEGQINRLKLLKRQMYDTVGECLASCQQRNEARWTSGGTGRFVQPCYGSQQIERCGRQEVLQMRPS
jgi:transposase